jgi:molybdopterin-guanine dinucleotide biosynthesis protein A
VTGGIVLTGGASRRFGSDKSQVTLATGETLAAHVLRLLRAACDPVIEVGPGVTDAPAIREQPPGSGPVAALLAGVDVVGTPVVVVACDQPAVTASVLERLATFPGDSLVPVLDGRPQYVCARYGPETIALLRGSLASGDRSFRTLGVDRLRALGASAEDFPAEAFVDLDTPEDLVSWRATEAAIPDRPGGAR